MIRYLTVEHVLEINTRFASGAVRDLTALRSAVLECQQGAFGTDFHPSLSEKAATLLRGISQNHAFIDGNKRTAFAVTEAFYGLNGFELASVDLTDFVVAVAQGQHGLSEVTAALDALTVPTPGHALAAPDLSVGLR